MHLRQDTTGGTVQWFWQNTMELNFSWDPLLLPWRVFFNATNNRYGLVTLKKRFGNVLMPEIELVDVKEKHRKKTNERSF